MREQEIADAALRLFIERGFEATKISDVAQRAGVAKGTIYLYFDDKESLFKKAIEAVSQPIDELRLSFIGHQFDFAADLKRILILCATKMAEEEVGSILRLIITEGRRFPELPRAWYSQVINPLHDLLSDMIAAGQAEGLVVPGLPHAISASIIGPLVSVTIYEQFLQNIDDARMDLVHLAETHAAICIGGLVTEKGRPR